MEKNVITGNETVNDLTIRQYFADAALQGILACTTVFGESNGASAKQAVMEADKLIEELNK